MNYSEMTFGDWIATLFGLWVLFISVAAMCNGFKTENRNEPDE